MAQLTTITTGRLNGNRTFMRSESWVSVLRRPEPVSFPVHSFAIELSDGITLIDAGLSTQVRVRGPERRFVPRPEIGAGEELGPALREAGINPGDVRRVVLTHLDWDHAGGLAQVPGAEVLVHRPELKFASRLPGRMRYRPRLWGEERDRMQAFDLEPEPWGPFPRSLRLGPDGELTIVPLAGHSAGQIGVALNAAGLPPLLFCADHFLRLDWFEEDLAAGRHLGLGIFFPERARESGLRLAAVAAEGAHHLIPSHDSETPGRLVDLATDARAARVDPRDPVRARGGFGVDGGDVRHQVFGD